MKLSNSLMILLCVIFLFPPIFSQGIKFEKITWEGKTVDAASDLINVKLKSNFTEIDLKTLLTGKGLSIETPPDFQKIARIRIDRKSRSITDLITELQASGMFEFVEPDFIIKASVTPNDTYYSNQYALPKINAPGAWDITTGDEGIIIGILDSGIPILSGNLSHPDLQNTSRIIEGEDYTGDGNGVKDENGHGTHVAGIAGAETNNSTGVAGINWNSKLRINQVFDASGNGTHSWFRNALINAVNNGCKIINFSGGSVAGSSIMENAVQYAQNNNVLLVAAAGNYDEQNNPNKVVEHPAAYSDDYDNVIAVSATNSSDVLADFSSRGSEVVVSAPGDNVYSTFPNYSVPNRPLNYGYNSGTSMSSPLVAGLSGLILSINPDLPPDQTREILENSAVDLGASGFDTLYGYGRIDAFEALKQTPTWNNVIQNNFYGNNGGSIKYQSTTYTSPYTIPNYYWQQTVSAINQNNNGIDFIFSHWDDGVKDKTRQLPLQNNGDYAAIFTGHFYSASPTALTHNGGRKVWTTPYWDGETGAGYRVVYEDNGDIYYTEYLEHPAFPGTYYWTDEILLSDGSGNNKNPAITASVDLQRACVVWQQYDPSLNRYHIKYREAQSGTWGEPVTISTTTTASEPQPVVGGTSWPFPPPSNPYYWHFVWNNGNGLKYALAQQDNIFYVVDIQGTDANCHNPTITDNYYNVPSTIGIAWDKMGHVYYQEVEYDAPQAPYNPVGSPVDLSCGIVGSQTPSISQAFVNYNMMLTWSANYEFESCNEEKGRIPTEAVGNKIIVARRKDGNGNWGIPRYIQYGSKYNNIAPSVGYNTSGHFHVLWEVQNQNKLAKLDYVEGEGWQSNGQAQIFTGAGIKTPSISSFGSSVNKAVWAINTSSPFSIIHQDITPAAEKLEQTTGNEVYREGIIYLSELIPESDGILIIELEAVEDISQNKAIPFAPVSREAVTFMGSDYFSPLANAAQYKLKVNLRGIGVEIPALSNSSNWEIFRAVLKAAPVNGKAITGNEVPAENPPNILKRFDWEELLRLIKSKDFYIEKEYVIDLSKWIGSSIYIDMELLKNLPVEVAFAEEIRLDDPSGNNIEGVPLLSKINSGISEDSKIIHDYALHPAYPNPFNPSTIIAFDLPETQHVKLEIFDISGRKVRTLVDQTVNAGRHQVSWNGQNESGISVASGIYLYRLQAGNLSTPTNRGRQGSGQVFVQSRKMTFLR
jgi:subtilisin family serine protease